MKMIYLIGLPGTGKTTIVRKMMNEFENWEYDRPIDLLDTQISSNKQLRVLGKYEEGQAFAGTDRLSMAVAPKAIEWIQSIRETDERILGEGDRLNNKSFFEAIGEDLIIIHLTVSDEERRRRYGERGSNQSDKFIQTIRTKCKNIVNIFGDQQTVFGVERGIVVEMKHENEEDTEQILNFIRRELLLSEPLN